MRYRDNDAVSLASVFLPLDDTTPTIDAIPRKWPNNAKPISDYSGTARWATDEKALVPTNQRTIRAVDFNRLADSICRIQHRLRLLSGTAYVIEDGEVQSTIENASLFNLTGLWAARKENTQIALCRIQDEIEVRFGYTYDLTEYMDELAPVHWWRFLEEGVAPGNGKTYADSGSGNAPLIPFEAQAQTPSPLYYKSKILNNLSKAVYANPYLGYADITDMTNGAFSISFWMKNITWTADHSDEDNIMSWGDTSEGGLFLFLQNGSSGYDLKMRLWRPGTDTNNITICTGLTNTSEWQRVTITLSALGAVKAYVNGTRTCNTTTSDNLGITVPSTSTTLRIPDTVRVADWMTGMGIDDLALFDYELTADQAYQLYYLSGNYSRYQYPYSDASYYTFEQTINIPSIFNVSGYSETSLTAVAQARIQDYGASSLWKTSNGNVLDYANTSPYMWTTCYIVSGGTQVKVVGNGYLPTPLLFERTKEWNVNSNSTINQLINGNNPLYVGYTYKTDHPTFRSKFENIGLTSTIGTTPNTSKRIELNTLINSSSTTTGGPYPIGDTYSEKGTSGGYLARKRDDYSDTYANVSNIYGVSDFATDVGIEFTINGYFFNTELLTYLSTEPVSYPIKSGLFLRMSTQDSTLEGYEDYPQYYGYFLRFNSLPVTSGMDGEAMNNAIYSYSIIKVSGDTLGAVSGDISSWWDSNSVSRPVDNNFHGKVQVLFNSTTPLVASINHSASHTPVQTGYNYVYRFRIKGDTLYLERKTTSLNSDYAGVQWENVISPVVDTDPLLPKDHCTYVPTGLYVKGVWGEGSSINSGYEKYQSTFVLSNIKDWWYYNNTSKKILLNVFLLKQNGDTTTPVVS